MTTTTEKVLNMKELADVLGVSYWTIWRWQREGKIPVIRMNKRVFFRLNSVMARLAKAEAESMLRE